MSASGSVVGPGVIATAVDHAIDLQRGEAGGVAPLDGAQLVPQGNLPAHLDPVAITATYARVVELNAAVYGMSPAATGAANRAVLDSLLNTTAKGLIDGGTPVKVIIPPGDYLMSKGVYADLTPGSGGLHVSGYGARLIFDATPTNFWAMLRISPTGWTAGVVPADTSTYLHDIYIEGLGVYDPDPVGHAGAEETHGLKVMYARNVRIWNCRAEGTGDEPIEVDYVEDFTIHDNYLFECQAIPGKALPDGANISIKNGCKRGSVYANAIDTSTGAGSKGIQVKIIEAAAVEDIKVFGNTIRNVVQAGLWINSSGGQARRVTFRDNIIEGGATGAGTAGSGSLIDCEWVGNTFRSQTLAGCNLQPQGTSSLGNRFDSNSILSCGDGTLTTTTSYGALLYQATSGVWASVHGNKMRDVQGRGFYAYGDDLKISGGELRNINLAAAAVTANQPAVDKGGTAARQIVESVTIINPGARGIRGVDYVRNCTVTGHSGDGTVLGVKEVNGGHYAGRISGIASGGGVLNAVVDTVGSTLAASVHGIEVSASTDLRIVGNYIRVPSGRRAWNEAAGGDRNLFMGNNYTQTVNVVGGASVQANNILAP